MVLLKIKICRSGKDSVQKLTKCQVLDGGCEAHFRQLELTCHVALEN